MKITRWSVGLIFLLVLLSNISHVVYVSEAQQEIEEDAKFRGVVVNSQDNPSSCGELVLDVLFYCVRVEEIIDDPNNILRRGMVIGVVYGGMLGGHPNADLVYEGDFVEVYAHCSLYNDRVGCGLTRDDHYIRRLSGQTATVTVTSTITSTVTRYTTVTSNTVTRTSTGTRTDYTTQTLVKDITNTFTVTQTVTTTTTLTAWATHTQTVTKTMRRCEEQVVIIIQLDEEDQGFYETYRIAPGTWGRSSDRPYPSWSHTVDYNLVAWYAFGAYPETGRKAPTCQEKQPLSFHVVVNERERISFLGKSYEMDFSLDLAGFPGDSLTVTIGRTKEDRLTVKKVEPSLVVKTAQDLEITEVRMHESSWNWCGPPFCGGRTYYYTVTVKNKSPKYEIGLMGVGVDLPEGYNWKLKEIKIVDQPDHGGEVKKTWERLGAISTIEGLGQAYFLAGVEGLAHTVLINALYELLDVPSEPEYRHVKYYMATTVSIYQGRPVVMWLVPGDTATFEFAIQETRYGAGVRMRPIFKAQYIEVERVVKIKNWQDLETWANFLTAFNWNKISKLYTASSNPSTTPRIPPSSSWSGRTEVRLQETGHKLYLHVYDDLNRHVGYNRETGQVEIGIPGSQYYDHQNGTIVISLPSGVFISSVRVDAGDAKEPREEYSLVVSTVDGMQVVDRKEVRGVIDKGRVVEYRVEASSDGKVMVVTPPPWYVSYWPVFAIAAVAAVAIAFRGRLRARRRKKLVVRESGKGGELTVIDKLSGRRYALGIFEENTAKDVIDILIERGLIKPTPGEGFQWALTDRSGSVISPAERLSSRLPEREVFLVARPVGGKRGEDCIELTVIDRLAGKRYTLEVFKENTARDVIDVLIESGLIKPGFDWILISPRLMQIHPDEKILSALSPGENEVFLIAKLVGGS
jgi:hypothetical protein